MQINRIKGTKDIFFPEVSAWQYLEKTLRALAESYFLSEIRTPIFENSDVFKRAIGDNTDIVSKEMFQFTDRGGRDICLRPEGTAGMVRAFVENSLHQFPAPRFFYMGPMFRAERPQKGRQRQFHQAGIEIFNDESPLADLDVILFNLELFERLGLDNYLFKLNSVGCPHCRPAYEEKLKAFWKPHVSSLCANCNERYDKNILRLLDCKEPSCQAVSQDAPSILNHLCEGCKSHLDELKSMLDTLKITYTLDPKIVRGLDYYVRTAFEIQLPDLGAQNAVCGGGRYDGLVSYFNPKLKVPAVGSAIGLERLIIALEQTGKLPGAQGTLDFYLIYSPEVARNTLLPVQKQLRQKNFSCLLSSQPRNFGKQFKEADRLGATKVLIFGETEQKNHTVSIKDMKSGSQTTEPLETWLSQLHKG